MFGLLLLIAMLIFAVIILVLFSYIRGEFYFSKVKDNEQMYLDIKALFGWIRFRFVIPVIQFVNFSEGIMIKAETVNKNQTSLLSKGKHNINKDRIMQYYNKVQLILENTFHLYEWMKQSLAQVQCTKLTWNTRIGVGDAPETAITTGIVWGLKSSLLGFIFQYVQLHTHPRVQVNPQYNSQQFSTEVSFAGRIRLGYAILAGFRLLLQISKVRGGFKNWYKTLIKPKIKSLTKRKSVIT